MKCAYVMIGVHLTNQEASVIYDACVGALQRPDVNGWYRDKIESIKDETYTTLDMAINANENDSIYEYPGYTISTICKLLEEAVHMTPVMMNLHYSLSELAERIASLNGGN